MKLISPTIKSSTHGFTNAPRFDSVDGKTIGLLSNSKVNADVLLRETAALFRSRNHCQVINMASKPNASAPAPDGTLKDLALACDFLITAMGD